MKFETSKQLNEYLESLNHQNIYAIYNNNVISFNRYILDNSVIYIESNVSIEILPYDLVKYEYEEYIDDESKSVMNENQFYERYYYKYNGNFYTTELPQTLPFLKSSNIVIDKFYKTESEVIEDYLSGKFNKISVIDYTKN